jgi:WD40 repeat protein
MPIDFNLLKTLSGHGYDVNTVAFSRDGRWLASGGGDRSVRVWNVDAQQELFVADHGEWVNDVAFAPHGQFLGARETVP